MQYKDVKLGMSVRVSQVMSGTTMKANRDGTELIGTTLTVSRVEDGNNKIWFREVDWGCSATYIEPGGMTKDYIERQIEHLSKTLRYLRSTREMVDRLGVCEITRSELNAMRVLDEIATVEYDDLLTKVKKIIEITGV